MRLGHAGEKSMQVLAKQGLLKGTKTCKLEALCIGQEDKDEVCTVIHCTKEILDYVHTDVWGPSSLRGKYYFVSFVYDSSRWN